MARLVAAAAARRGRTRAPVTKRNGGKPVRLRLIDCSILSFASISYNTIWDKNEMYSSAGFETLYTLPYGTVVRN